MTLRDLSREIPILFRLSWPIVIGQIGQMLFGLIDVVMVGRVGTVELAAISFANSVYVIFLVFGIGISNSTSPLVSRALGRKDLAGAWQIMKNSLRLSVGLGLALTVLALLMLFFFDRMGQETAVAEKGKTFYGLICLTLVPALVYQSLKQVLESLGHPKIPMVAMVIGLGLNIGLNFVFIFGAGPIEPMGLVGAAVGTNIARLVMVAILFLFVYRARRLHEFRAAHQSNRKGDSWQVVGELLKLGVPSGFVVLFEVGAFASAAIMMGWLGSVELAAHQVALSLAAMSFMVPMGISFAAGIRVGFEAGRNDFRAARVSGITALLFAAMFMTPIALLFAAGNQFWPRLFTEDPAVQALAGQLLIVAAVFQLVDGIQVVDVGILRALKDVRWPLAISLTAYWIIALPMGYLLAFKSSVGPLGIWYGLAAGLFVVAIFLTIRFLKLVTREALNRST